ncbi:type IV pilin-like G/H family protein [Gloeothece verrucosa]|uniref:Pilin polypeptide n=1 Tax=Gloeothece verrucosa (strain PCC 7822) TaxID=497965 RepID=E0U6U2_GLOV7|nr:type IV pilin-like G/H family protein [Gloeothece verrucosa]ADN15979.1 pilin polypeptide [Gloeothece verrucosa PCC 7822]
MNKPPKQRKKLEQGFTLLELLMAFLLLNVLMIISYQMSLKQVEKARQAEALSTLGLINRAQQFYKFEHSTFTSLNNLSISIGSDNGNGTYSAQYYIFSDTNIESTYSGQRASASPVYQNDILNYASAISQKNDGTFTNIICESTSTTADDAATSQSNNEVFCSGGHPMR